MASEHLNTTERTTRRGVLDRLRASPFLSQLLSNRLALFGIGIILGMVLIAVYARVSYDVGALANSRLGGTIPSRAPPSWAAGTAQTGHFGTDAAARDIFRRTMYGAWIALKFGTITVAASTVLGISLGILAAYYGDVANNVIMRTMDVLLAFPSLLLALALVAISARACGRWLSRSRWSTRPGSPASFAVPR